MSKENITGTYELIMNIELITIGRLALANRINKKEKKDGRKNKKLKKFSFFHFRLFIRNLFIS